MNQRRAAIVCRQFPSPASGDFSGGYAVRTSLILRDAGLSVTLCALRTTGHLDECSQVDDALRPLGVTTTCLFQPEGSDARDSLAVLKWLERFDFDIAVFVGCEDVAYWSVQARRTRVGLLSTPIVLLSSDPMAITHDARGGYLGPELLLRAHLQREAAHGADRLICLNRASLAAYEGIRSVTGTDTPPSVYVEEAAPFARKHPFGETAIRRLTVFTDALNDDIERQQAFERFGPLLKAWSSETHREMTIVGLDGRMVTDTSRSHVQAWARLYRMSVEWLHLPDYVTAFRSGSRSNDVALFVDRRPSSFDGLSALVGVTALTGLVDNSPYASLFREDAEALLFEPSQQGFLHACRRRVVPRVAARAALVAAVRSSTTSLTAQILELSTQSPLTPFELAVRPKVSVCISHFNRPDLLDQAVRSLEAQTYDNVEVIIVDDASPGEDAQAYLRELEPRLAKRGGKLLRNCEEKWQQESRNIAARAATGQYVLIMDDDNCARPDEIMTMVTTAEATNAVVVRCLQNNFDGDEYPKQDPRADTVDFFPTGGPLSLGTMWNVFGDVNVLFRRDYFLRIGGFTSTNALGCEDFEIGIRYGFDDVKSVTVPRVLYDYRLSEMNMAKRMDNKRLYDSHARLAALYERHVPEPVAPIFRLLNERFHRIWQRHGHAYWARTLPKPSSFGAQVVDTTPVEADALYVLAGLLAEAGAQGDARTLTTELLSMFPDHAGIASLHQRVEGMLQ